MKNLDLRKLSASLAVFGMASSFVWGQETTVFDYTGDVQTYVVPAGITRINIEAFGAEGGTSLNDSSSCIIGGLGGSATGNLLVTPGETLHIYVGGRGYAGDTGGWNGGGDACDNTSTCAKGGGASDVRYGGTDLTDRIIVAGGGGGAEWSGCSGAAGGGGGLEGVGGAHPTPGGRNGGGGTQDAGGVAGVGDHPGGVGTFGVGGAGGTHPSGHSGSGGGGWYGGGGSAEDGHAGGGSSYIGGVTDSSTTAAVRSGNGQIIITELCNALTVTVSSTEICLGEEITLTASGDGTVVWDGGVVNGEAFTPEAAGTVTYTATSDADMDCGFSTEITIHALPDVTAAVDDEEICLGEEITLTGGGADTYSWDPADILDGVAYEPAAAGTITYTVTGTDAGTECENTAEVEVQIHALPVVEAVTSEEAICIGDELTLSGSGALTYVWTPATVEDGVAFTPDALGAATYTVVGTDENGCQNEGSVEVTVNDLPVVTASVDLDEVCFGDEITLTGGGAETYTWDPADVTDGEPYETNESGLNTFTVTGTDANGCQNSAGVDVNVLDEIVVTLVEATDEIGGTDGAIDIDVAGGTEPYTFDWDNDEADDFDDDEDLLGLAGGTYTVTVKDGNDCTALLVVEVNSQVGLTENSALNALKIYPNPTTGLVMIDGEGTYIYELRTAAGTLITTNTATDLETLNLENYANGIYFITIRMDVDVKTVKLIKQ